MVFHTAPPQPASKARMTCSPVLVGGAEASQKGFGEAMPAKFTARLTSGIGSLQLAHHRQSGTLAIGNSIHNLTAAVYAVPAGEVFRIRCLPCLTIDDHASPLKRDPADALQEIEQR